MSAFCIFGVSKSRCLELARNRAELVLRNDQNQIVRRLTEAEWEARVTTMADEIFAKAKEAAISPRFDAPPFALRWLELANKTGDIRDGVLMALTPTGEKHPKTKEPILKWMVYRGPGSEQAAA